MFYYSDFLVICVIWQRRLNVKYCFEACENRSWLVINNDNHLANNEIKIGVIILIIEVYILDSSGLLGWIGN